MCSIRRMSFPFVGSWWCWMSQGELFALRIFSLIDCCHLENFGTAGHETCPVCHLYTACTNCMDVSQQLPCYCSSGASSSPALTSLIINQQPCHPLVFHFPQLTPPAPLCQRACSSSSSWASHSGGSTLTGLRGCTCLYPLTAVTAND